MMKRSKTLSRREWLGTVAAGVATTNLLCATTAQPAAVPLAGELGVTTGSFMRHLSSTNEAGNLRLIDLPEILRSKLQMRVIDLMTATLPSLDSVYLKQLKNAADDAGCILTNLKMNQPGLHLGSADADERRRAIEEYRRTIDAAALLGVRWVRPLPGPMRPDLDLLAAGFRALIDYAAPLGISLLVENFGWLASDPSAIPELIDKVGGGLAAQPDTGNWSNNDVRYAGLAKAFPHAVSCDFKARPLGLGGTHAEYDLQHCFEIGWKAGFRGPWCFEYEHASLEVLYHDLGVLRDKLRQWMAAAKHQ